MLLTGEQLSGYLNTFERSAFRLEVHQVYTMPDEVEELRLFLSGGEKPQGGNVEWHSLVRSNVESGKTMQRVKIVRRPFTDYTRYLMSWEVPDNVAAGEDYRILDLTDREVGLPEQDFWLFDESTVALVNINPDGTLLNLELVESTGINQYLQWRDLALAESVPFTEYALEDEGAR
ncbi:DUF6879 family protein [Streptoalloteichus hindustanus]|uniref:DUF6879 domain-containing protein n=1 Tax=Streptoalloteichus hindustanus TaxID=2017 RepID=A0A1M5A8I9_STRHI|nr:DUF6879 family protein [Streptoalloteichus hindustanus]SHF26610.1 hypothetical protein SAMN05444320_10315 [Streptoalloteichus hindustanus]